MAGLTATEMEVVGQDQIAVQPSLREGQQLVAEPGFTGVCDRRLQPFNHDGIALQEETQRLRQVPTVHIHIADQRCLNDIPAWPDGQGL
jgi:hypothetical protein